MKEHLYTLPAKGSAPLAIVATMPTRRVDIMEDDTTASQGIVCFFPQDNFTAGYTYADAHQPVTLGEQVAFGGGKGSILGFPAQIDTGVPAGSSPAVTRVAATVLFKATSASATATNIRVVEFA